MHKFSFGLHTKNATLYWPVMIFCSFCAFGCALFVFKHNIVQVVAFIYMFTSNEEMYKIEKTYL